MMKHTEGDAKAELAPMFKKLERLGEDVRSTRDTIVTRAKELGHPELTREAWPHAVPVATDWERKYLAEREAREHAETLLEQARTRKTTVGDGATARATADYLGLPGMYPLSMFAANVISFTWTTAFAIPPFEMIPRLIVIPRECAIGRIVALFAGCMILAPQHPWNADMRCFVPEAWHENGRDFETQWRVLAFPKHRNRIGCGIPLTMQIELEREAALWSCLVMCEPWPETAR